MQFDEDVDVCCFPKLSGSDSFTGWKLNMRNALIIAALWGLINGTDIRPAVATAEELEDFTRTERRGYNEDQHEYTYGCDRLAGGTAFMC